MTNQGRGFKAINYQLQMGQVQMKEVIEKDGSVSISRNRILQRAKEFYEELFSSDTAVGTSPKALDTFPRITSSEVERAMVTSKNGRANGLDGVGMDLLKASGSVLYARLADIFNDCLVESTITDIWNDAAIILLHKKGDPKDLNNYRPISLLNCVYKLFTKIITSRIETILDESQPVEQAGFRRGFSTMDHLHTVNQVIEKSQEYQLPLVMAFVDYTKAFDSVKTATIVESLEKQGVDQVYVEIFRHIYTSARAHVQMDGASESFPLKRGVRQGDTSSPKLFTAILETVFRRLNWEEKGIYIDGKCLSHLRFADDVVVFSNSYDQVQTMLTELNQAGKISGLQINHNKTKLLTNLSVDYNLPILLDGVPIQHVEEYIYLGQKVTMDPSKEKEITRRVSIGWQAFGKASWIFRDPSVPLTLKRKLYDQCILPSVVYGAETWNLTKSLALKLRSMQRAHERVMLRVSLRDHMTSDWIRSKTKLTDVIQVIYRKKWRWAGHVARMNDDRWTARATSWIPYGHRRRRGRQRIRWRDDLDRSFTFWRRLALDRDEWRSKEEAYIRLRIF